MQQEKRQELYAALLAGAQRKIAKIGFNDTGIPGFHAVCRTQVGEARLFLNRFVSVILQGRKSKTLNGRIVEYGAGDCVVNCIDIPTDSVIENASPEKPFVSLVLDLDRSMLTDLALEMAQNGQANNCEDVRTLLVEKCPDALAENFMRLLDLADRPEEIQLLAPMIKREIHARLLLSDMGPSIRSVHAYGTRANQIAQAVTIIRENFRQSINMEELANRVNMSPASFHRHFKAFTGCSPLRYQKELRLHEARRALALGQKAVSSVAFELGYASTSQFASDYKGFFGVTPKQEAMASNSSVG
ncbi:MAG: AraC family transcriptional regulator [Sutterellaceae bacterium]|nr:AraC family transcriptional regulator [Sutterellaceae bacterium]